MNLPSPIATALVMVSPEANYGWLQQLLGQAAGLGLAAALLALLILPAVISLQHHTGARLTIAGVSLVILLGALAFSKRGSEAMDADAADSAPAVAAVAPVE